MENIVFLREDPNIDIINIIYRIEDRAEKLLTISIAVMSFNAFLNNTFLVLISTPFFLISFIFYLLAFIQSPSIVSLEMPREEMYVRLEMKMKQSQVTPTELNDLANADKTLRKLLITVRKRKSTFLQIGNCSFFSFIFIFFTTYLINKNNIRFFDNYIQVFLYILVFILISVVLFLTLYKFKTKEIVAYKGNAEPIINK